MATCTCGSDSKNLVYACSGAANTGLLADRVARQISIMGAGSMTCLAAMGANLDGFVTSAGCAKMNLVIDGCPVACGKAIFEKLGIPFEHAVITNYGVEKGKTAITDSLGAEITERIIADKKLI